MVWALADDASVSRDVGRLAVLFGDGAAEWSDGGLTAERVDESDGREELGDSDGRVELLELEEEEAFDWVDWRESLGAGDRAQSVFPLEAAFDES